MTKNEQTIDILKSIIQSNELSIKHYSGIIGPGPRDYAAAARAKIADLEIQIKTLS